MSEHGRERFGLRLRFALFFAALGLGGVGIFGLGLWVGFARSGGGPEGYATAGLIGGFGLIGLAALIGYLFDENVARPILALASDLHTRATSKVSVEIDDAPARYLGTLAPAARAIHDALEEARTSQARAIAEKTQRMARDKALLEVLVRDLEEGVIVISGAGRIVLYNQAGLQSLGALGLDRKLERFVRMDPILDACERLTKREGVRTESFLTSSVDGGRILVGTVAAIQDAAGGAGHVIMFRDATEDLRNHGHLDQVLGDLIEHARRPAMNIRAVLDVLSDAGDVGEEMRVRLMDGLSDELGHLVAAIDVAERHRADASMPHWPIRATPFEDIADMLGARGRAAISVDPTGTILLCDGHAVTLILEQVARVILDHGGRTELHLQVDAGGRTKEALLRLSWKGQALEQRTIEALMAAPLSDAYGVYSVGDALHAHQSAVWVEDGGAVVMPLTLVEAESPVGRIEERLDFYDFDLSQQASVEGAIASTAFVVFDTETTGLDVGRDAVVQLSGVRVVNGRRLRSEQFDMLVDPGRPIPPSSTAIHKITDEMVQGAEKVDVAASRFAEFCDGAVLVAHNAAFDMAFLKREEAKGGVVFDHPVICTARLSAALKPHLTDHTLDGLAERYGITIPEELRHTALGDACATADIFLKMLPIMEDRGINSLQGALDLQASFTKKAKGAVD